MSAESQRASEEDRQRILKRLNKDSSRLQELNDEAVQWGLVTHGEAFTAMHLNSYLSQLRREMKVEMQHLTNPRPPRVAKVVQKRKDGNWQPLIILKIYQASEGLIIEVSK